MYHPDILAQRRTGDRAGEWSSPQACPALVLNADYTPLSYYPLSLWSWQDAIKACFLERVDVVAHYDRTIRSPGLEMRLPSVVALRNVGGRNRARVVITQGPSPSPLAAASCPGR